MTLPNVAVVVFDTLRKDTFDRHFDWLVDDSVYFENAWSTSRWTIPAHASLFTGLFGSEVGSYSKNHHFNYDGECLAELLSSEGYRTRGISANPNLDPRLGFDRGFEDYISINGKPWKHHVDGGLPPTLRYADFVKNVILRSENPFQVFADAFRHKTNMIEAGASRIRKIVEKWGFNDAEFLFLNFMEPHSPYSAPTSYQSVTPMKLNGLEATAEGGKSLFQKRVRQAYEDCSKYLSDVYEKIHERLTDEFDLVITLSDHGEAFGEYGIWGHMCVPIPEITHIPLVISGDASSDITSTSKPVNILDVFQTICYQMRTATPRNTRGQPLQEDIGYDRAVLVETSGLTGYEEKSAASMDNTQSIISTYDKNRYGVSVKGGYSFEKTDGDIETVGSVENPEKKIQSLRDEVSSHNGLRNQSIPVDLEDQLQELGYL